MPSAEAFADDLRRYLRHEPVQARSDSLIYRGGKFVRRHRVGVALAAAASLALLVSSAVALWQAYSAGRERDAALAEARRADSVGDFMSTLLGDFSRSATPQAQRAYLDHARELLQRKHYDDPLLRANLLSHLAARYQEFGYPDTAIALMQQAKADPKSAEDEVARAQVGCALANMYDDQNREIDAEREIHAAIVTLDRLGRDVRPQVRADCRLVESYVATAREKNTQAIAAAQKALDELNAAGLSSGMSHVTALNALARANAYAGNNAAAVKLLREIRAGEAESGAPQSIGAWIHEFNEARDLLAGGRVLQAEQLAADLLSTSHGGDSGSHDLTLLRAEILVALDRSAEATRLLQQGPRPAGATPGQRWRALLGAGRGAGAQSRTPAARSSYGMLGTQPPMTHSRQAVLSRSRCCATRHCSRSRPMISPPRRVCSGAPPRARWMPTAAPPRSCVPSRFWERKRPWHVQHRLKPQKWPRSSCGRHPPRRSIRNRQRGSGRGCSCGRAASRRAVSSRPCRHRRASRCHSSRKISGLCIRWWRGRARWPRLRTHKLRGPGSRPRPPGRGRRARWRNRATARSQSFPVKRSRSRSRSVRQ